MERITSRQNPLVQQIRKLNNSRSHRRTEGLFVGEGPKLLAEALGAGMDIGWISPLSSVTRRAMRSLRPSWVGRVRVTLASGTGIWAREVYTRTRTLPCSSTLDSSFFFMLDPIYAQTKKELQEKKGYSILNLKRRKRKRCAVCRHLPIRYPRG